MKYKEIKPILNILSGNSESISYKQLKLLPLLFPGISMIRLKKSLKLSGYTLAKDGTFPVKFLTQAVWHGLGGHHPSFDNFITVNLPASQRTYNPDAEDHLKEVTVILQNSELDALEDMLTTELSESEMVTARYFVMVLWHRLVKAFDQPDD